MIRKLEAQELVHLEGKKIQLTTSGLELAQKLISVHRLWEYFLIQVLNLDEEKAHWQADLLEHVTSRELYQALSQYLGEPDKSPSGKIIYKNQIKSKK